MHLIYLDESGNSGVNLTDPQQPIFVLGALIVPETKWRTIEAEFIRKIETFFNGAAPNDFEVHASEIRSGRGVFKGMGIARRMAFRDDLLQTAVDHKLDFVYRAIAKKRYSVWLERTFGKGITINPHIAAYPLVSQVINGYLRNYGKKDLGILINDDNKEVVVDIERTTRVLRADSTTLQLDRIIEKSFFIDSSKSHLLQLADLCTFYARKKEEIKAGLPEKSIDQKGIELIEPLIYTANESMADVLAWLTAQNKRSGEGPGGAKSPSGGHSRR